MLGGFLHICTCTCTIYCGLWPSDNTTSLFLTWYQSGFSARDRRRQLAPATIAGSHSGCPCRLFVELLSGSTVTCRAARSRTAAYGSSISVLSRSKSSSSRPVRADRPVSTRSWRLSRVCPLAEDLPRLRQISPIRPISSLRQRPAGGSRSSPSSTPGQRLAPVLDRCWPGSPSSIPSPSLLAWIGSPRQDLGRPHHDLAPPDFGRHRELVPGGRNRPFPCLRQCLAAIAALDLAAVRPYRCSVLCLLRFRFSL
jgi:hypothetical protein